MATHTPSDITKKAENDVDVVVVAVILSLIILPLLIGGIAVSLRNHNLATKCDGKPDSPKIKEVSGMLISVNGTYVIPGERANWVVLKCGRNCAQTPLWKEFSSGLGKPASATFCNDQLLGVVVDGMRLK